MIQLTRGSIIWLRKKDEIKDDDLGDVQDNAGCFDHPVVVLRTNRAKTEATILIVSLASACPLRENHPTLFR
jgi:hypothetical protein